MIKHIVLWKIGKDNSTVRERADIINIFQQKTAYLKSIIPEIRDATVGTNINHDGFHVCIDSVFDSLDDLNKYIYHPEHLKVREFMNSVSYDKTSFDYEF